MKKHDAKTHCPRAYAHRGSGGSGWCSFISCEGGELLDAVDVRHRHKDGDDYQSSGWSFKNKEAALAYAEDVIKNYIFKEA